VRRLIRLNFEYLNIEEIEATSPKEAEKIYNKKYNCSYWYARCLGTAFKEDQNS
jgi:hypothetical protein